MVKKKPPREAGNLPTSQGAVWNGIAHTKDLCTLPFSHLLFSSQVFQILSQRIFALELLH